MDFIGMAVRRSSTYVSVFQVLIGSLFEDFKKSTGGQVHRSLV